MAKHYRPILPAKAGELAGLRRLGSSLHSSCSPVFRIPERTWDYENGRYAKTHEDHIVGVPDKLASAWKNGSGYLDLALLEQDSPVGGKHPLEYLFEETRARSVHLVPLVSSSSTSAHLAAAATIHAASNCGVAVQLPQADWTTVNPAALSDLMSAVSVPISDIDIFVDFEDSRGPVTEIAAISELASLRGLGSFRSVTVGGAGFPDVTGVPRGTTEYPRHEWNAYSSISARMNLQGAKTPDFFDHAVQNPDLIELGVDPRFLSISASFRYAVADKWLFAKGELFKGKGSSSKGGAALITPLDTLTRHPEHGTPIRSIADDWIDAVIKGSDTPGAPQKWREWATVRHLEVTASQLATLI